MVTMLLLTPNVFYSLVIENDRLTVLSHSGFSSIKANVCVFKVSDQTVKQVLTIMIVAFAGQMAVRGDAEQQGRHADWLGHP